MKKKQINVANLAATVQPISADVLNEKYLKAGEQSADDVFRRVAHCLAQVEPEDKRAQYEAQFLANLRAGAIGAGRIMSAAGTSIQATLINCFVQPVGDCIQGVDDGGFPGIYEALREAAETMRRGGGVGYDFSRIRPRGARVKGTASEASGPCSYINVFDQSCSTVESAGARRGAQMGVLRIDHPDVLDFITAKRTPGRWSNFNVSVAVPDQFFEALHSNAAWDLVHSATPSEALVAQGAYQRSDGIWVYRSLPAAQLWDTIMQSAYDFAEPGILFLDSINRDNNLHYCETIAVTNPCGEQPLPSYGCCDLGPIILPRFVHHPFEFGGQSSFDFSAFTQAVTLQVRALDNVLEATFWPLPEQRKEAMAKRRIGVGFTGLGNALTMLGLRYDEEAGRMMAQKIAETMRDAAYSASIALAQEKGGFPALDVAGYLAPGSFASRLPAALQAQIRQHGIRNSHLLSIAPTGTVSLAFADNASNGIEPAFSWSYRRKKREADGSITDYAVQDHAWRVFAQGGGDTSQLPAAFVSALEISAADHVRMMACVQPFIDTAISKTVNVPADYPYSEFKGLYLQAWKAGLKGLATYRPNAIVGSVLDVNVPAAVEPEAAFAATPNTAFDPMRVVINSRPIGALDAVAEKIEYWTQEGLKTLYLIVSFLPIKNPSEPQAPAVQRAVEFFMPVGQSGESQQWITASMRLLSLAARGGFLGRALSDMRKVAWDRGPVRFGYMDKADGTRVPLWHDSEVAAIAYAIQQIMAQRNLAQGINPTETIMTKETSVVCVPDPQEPGVMVGKKCTECGAHAVIRKDGCEFCTQCGYVGACG